MATNRSNLVALKGKTPKPKMVRLTITIVIADGANIISRIPLEGEVALPKNGEGIALDVTLDAREVVATIDAALGPKKPTPTKLWTPGG